MSDAKAPPETDEPRVDSSTPDEPDPLLLRALADLDNVRKRYERRLATAAEEERLRVLSLWLPVVDDLERALQHSEGDPARVIEGVRAVYDHAVALLAGLGLQRFDDVGRKFDPERHDAVGVVNADAPAGTVVATAQAGYENHGATVRPARVVVAQSTEPGTPDAQKPG
jgi:molecular chaperone GrpE